MAQEQLLLARGVPKLLIITLGRREILKSLNTDNRADAEALHLQHVATWKATFAELSRPDQKVPPPQRRTEAEAQAFARQFFRRAKEDFGRSKTSPAELNEYEREVVAEDLQDQLAVLSSWSNPDTHFWVEKASKSVVDSKVTLPAAGQAGQNLSEFVRIHAAGFDRTGVIGSLDARYFPVLSALRGNFTQSGVVSLTVYCATYCFAELFCAISLF